MSGDDVISFLEDVWFDLINLGHADIVSLFFRIVLVVFGAIIVLGMTQFIFKVFFGLLRDFFGPVYRWFKRNLSRFLWGPVRKIKSRSERKRQEKKQREYLEQQERERIWMAEESARKEVARQKEAELVLKSMQNDVR